MKTRLILSIGLIAAGLFAGNPQLAIDKAGNLVDEQGKIKYYVAQSMGHVEQGRITLYGKLWRGKYPEKYRYLYEGFRDEDYFRRTGINMMHFDSENTELAALVPEYTPEKLDHFYDFYHEMLKKYNAKKMIRQWARKPYDDYIKSLRTFNNTPLYLNFRSYSSLVLRSFPDITKQFLKPGAIADNPRGSGSSLCGDLSSEAGRDFMRKLCEYELDWCKMVGVEPFACKIYNEPSYENYSPYARKDFVGYLKEKYGTVEAMNKAWGTSYKSFEEPGVHRKDRNFSLGAGIEFRKMSEKRYADMTNELAELIRKKIGKPTFIQLMGGIHAASLEHGNNIYLLHNTREIIVSGTGNYTFSSLEDYADTTPARDALSISKDLKIELLRHGVYFPMAKNKPYLDTENYVAQAKAPYFRAVMWRELALGKPTILFWQLGGLDKPGLKRPIFALLYPEVIQPQELEIWKKVPREIEKTDTLFLDRRNKYYAPQAGFLYSNATLRRAAFTSRHQGLERTLDILGTLHFSYFDYAGVFEENIGEKIRDFKVFFLGDVTNTTEEAAETLLNYVKDGGILFISGVLPKNEYDKPLKSPLWDDIRIEKTRKISGTIPQFRIKAVTDRKISAGKDWTVTAELNKIPVMAEKKIGKGKVIVFAAQMQDYALAEILKPVMKECGIRPYGEILKANKDEQMPNIEIFVFREPGGKKRHGWILFNHNQLTKQFRIAIPKEFKTVWDPVKGERYPVENGYASVMLSPLDCSVLIANDPRESGEIVSSEALAKRLKEQIKKDLSGKLKRKSSTVDFVNYANIGFDNAQHWPTDSVFIEKDHKYLQGVPFHKQVFGDIVFDIIRFDFNSNRVCITLKSKPHPAFPESVTIPVSRQCGDIMLLTSSVGGKTGDPAFSVKLNYADGTSVTQKLFKGKEIADWKISRNSQKLQKQSVWSDPDGYGLFLTEVHNPKPSKLLNSITLISADNGVVPVICGISVLDTIYKKDFKNSVPLSEVFPIMTQPKLEDQDINNSWEKNYYKCTKGYSELQTEDNQESPYLDTPEKIDRCVIRGAVRIDRDEAGKFHPLTWFTISLPDSKTRYMRYRDYMDSFFQNKSAEHWIEFEIPLKNFRGNLKGIRRMAVFPGRQQGITKHIRDLRLEW